MMYIIDNFNNNASSPGEFTHKMHVQSYIAWFYMEGEHRGTHIWTMMKKMTVIIHIFIF
uniref:Uncharacterized protein n=1 Tax=Arundo donax TaxID=35708 RepID=A0A0A8XSE6_ARUDO